MKTKIETTNFDSHEFIHTHTHTQARTRAHTHAHARMHAHARTKANVFDEMIGAKLRSVVHPQIV